MMVPSNQRSHFVSALLLSKLPKFSEFINRPEEIFDSPFNSLFLSNTQILASQIEELCELINLNGIPDYNVVLCELVNLKGCVYLEGEIDWPIIFLDSSKTKSLDELRMVYIHEAAHLKSDGQGHDFIFSIVNNTYLLKSGYPLTDSEYDYRDCLNERLPLDEVVYLSKEVAGLLNRAFLMDEIEFTIIQYCNQMMSYGHEDKTEFLRKVKYLIDSSLKNDRN